MKEINKESDEVSPIEHNINDILIVGDSEASFEFVGSLQEVETFSKITHVSDSSEGVQLLLYREFSTIIIDCQAIDDPISFSNNIRVNLPLSRIIIIAKEYQEKLIRDLINLGSIDAFIPLPIDAYSGASVIIEQYAKYQINKNLYDMITINPPKFSQSYFLLHNSDSDFYIGENVQFVGFVVMYASLTKFTKFYGHYLELDEYLITGYLSAITLLGEQLFQQESYFKEINFGSLNLVMKRIDDVQYIFFFANLPKYAYDELEKEMDSIVHILHTTYFDEFTSELPLDTIIDNTIIEKIHKFNQRHQQIIDESREQNLVLFGNQLPKLNAILAKNNTKYNITRLFAESELVEHLNSHTVDILIINQVLYNNNWNFTIADHAKEINPGVQIIALMQQTSAKYLLQVLNNENIDFVISYKDAPDLVEYNLDHAFSEALKIKQNLMNYHPQNLKYSLHRSVVARSLLRYFKSSFEISNVPEFYGVFVLQDDLPYYQKIWSEDFTIFLNFDEQLFAGFINSLEMFTKEIFEDQQEFTGFTFGDMNIIIKRHFDFSFIFFLSQIDHTNSLMIESLLDSYAELMYHAIVSSEGFFNYDMELEYDITADLDQLMTELFIKLVSLNFTS